MQLSDYEADAEINPDKEVPDGVPVISSLVQGTFYQGVAALTDAEKAMIRMMDPGELTELENYLKSVVQGTFYQGDAAFTDAEKAMIRMMDQGELTELENYLKSQLKSTWSPYCCTGQQLD